jgi:Ca2+-binding EF-hand superfamily protein
MCRFLLWTLPIANLLFLFPSELPAQSSEPKTTQARLFAFLDQNRNGVIDPAEFKHVPLPMRVWLAEIGIDSTKPFSQAQFLKLAPRMMQAIRAGRHAGREKTPSRSVSLISLPSRTSRLVTSGNTVSPSTSSISSTSSNRGLSSVSSMLTLPSSYSEGDIDGDGQIGMYEWKKWKKSTLSQFLKLDRNDDGFLTPRELRSTPSGSSSSPATTTVTASITPSTSTDKHKAKALSYFNYMDVNKSGSIEPQEWIKGRSVKPVFETAKVDVSKPLTKELFIAGYVKGKSASE